MKTVNLIEVVEVYRNPESKYLYNDILTEDSHPEQK